MEKKTEASGAGSACSAVLDADALQAIANAVCRHCPERVQISLHMENGGAWVEAIRTGEWLTDLPDSADKTLLEQLNDALAAANGWASNGGDNPRRQASGSSTG